MTAARMASLAFLLSGACASGPKHSYPYQGPFPDASPDAYVGCYEARYLKHDRWRTDDRWTFRLFPEAASSRKPGGGNALPQRRATASNQDRDDPWWRITPTGFQMHVGDTLHGFYAEFQPTGDGFGGSVFFYADTFRGFGVQPVSARKVACTDGADGSG